MILWQKAYFGAQKWVKVAKIEENALLRLRNLPKFPFSIKNPTFGIVTIIKMYNSAEVLVTTANQMNKKYENSIFLIYQYILNTNFQYKVLLTTGGQNFKCSG